MAVVIGVWFAVAGGGAVGPARRAAAAPQRLVGAGPGPAVADHGGRAAGRTSTPVPDPVLARRRACRRARLVPADAGGGRARGRPARAGPVRPRRPGGLPRPERGGTFLGPVLHGRRDAPHPDRHGNCRVQPLTLVLASTAARWPWGLLAANPNWSILLLGVPGSLVGEVNVGLV